MRISKEKEFAILDWCLLLGITAAAVLISEVSGFRAEWEDVTILTVVVFTVVITTLRSSWGPVFWRSVALLFAAHALVVLFVLQVLPQRRFGIPKLLLTAFGVAETFVIGTVLWKKTAAARRHEH
jgi:hypothetical protein